MGRSMILTKQYVTEDRCRCHVFGAAELRNTTRLEGRENYGNTPDKTLWRFVLGNKADHHRCPKHQ